MTYLLAGCLWLIGQCVAMMAALKGEPWTCAEGVTVMLLGASLIIWRSSHGPVSYLQDRDTESTSPRARVHGHTAGYPSKMLRLRQEDTGLRMPQMLEARTETCGYAYDNEHGHDQGGVQRTVLEVSRGMGCRASGEGRTNPGETEVAT